MPELYWPWDVFTGKGTEETNFLKWVRQKYGASAELKASWNYKASPYYQEWVRLGKPGWAKEAPQPPTEAERVEELRGKIDPTTGFIPYSEVGKEWQPYLEAQGYELVKEDPLGVLPEEQWVYRPKVVEPTKPEGELIAGYPMTWWEYGIPQWQAQQRQEAQERLSTQQWQQMLRERERTMAAQAPGRAEALDIERRRMMAEGWEYGRQQALSELTGERDWIRRYELERMVNPYLEEAKPFDLAGEIKRLTEIAESRRQRALASMEESGGGIPPQAAELLHSAAKIEGEAAKVAKQSQEQARSLQYMGGREAYAKQFGEPTLAQKQQMAWTAMEIGEEPTPEKPRTPPTPAWLPQFVPQLKAGEPIAKYPIATPSGQQWMRMPWSQREKFAGYAEWAGQPYRDILERMAMMRPRTPTTSRRWTPAKQRVSV